MERDTEWPKQMVAHDGTLHEAHGPAEALLMEMLGSKPLHPLLYSLSNHLEGKIYGH